MFLRLLRSLALAALLLAPVAHAAPLLDATPRTAVISAFDAELARLLAQTAHARTHTVNGVRFTTGVLAGKPVVLFLSGISMTNAAMNTQLVLDRFRVRRIVFSGIAGGVNPALHIGDVSVPEQWGPYLETLLAREAKPGEFRLPPDRASNFPGYGMMFAQPVGVRRAGAESEASRFWFAADPQLVALARTLENVPLERCAAGTCLAHAPRLVVGGNGVSGSAFVDNAAFREYAFRTFSANVLDMESAALAQVAYANNIPFVVFRSLSDLAGGGEGENEIGTFFRIAADNSARVVVAFLKALP